MSGIVIPQPGAAPAIYVFPETGEIGYANVGNNPITVVRFTNPTDVAWSGFSYDHDSAVFPNVDGQLLFLMSVGAGNVFLRHEDVAGAVPSARMLNDVTSMPVALAAGKGGAIYVYDASGGSDDAGRWQLMSQTQGAAIPYAIAWSASGATQPSLGNGTLTGEYYLNGNTMQVLAQLSPGSTTTYGAGDWIFTIPMNVFPMVANPPVAIPPKIPTGVGSGFAIDVSTGLSYPLGISYTDNFGGGMFGVTATPAAAGASVPFAWAAGDFLRIALHYDIN